ncbi:L-lactate permease [Ruminococcaceae bacterium OttesenSCG-928-A11]|nr:L-lactate permease [Ruminococcaceae bacterium OttesenSCG-928-A11]
MEAFIGWPAFGMAFLPIAVLIALLLVFKVRASVASLCGLGTAILVGVLYFGAPASGLPLQAVKGAWNALSIFIVICPAMLIYQVLSEADMFTHIKAKVSGMLRDDLLQVLFIGWAFAGFLQSVTGFGVPVAVCAPILVGFGFSPVTAVIISILGHAWGGTFGTLAIAWDSMLMQAGITDGALIARTALNTGLMLWLETAICGFVIYALYKKKQGEKKIVVREIIYVIVISAVQGGGQLLTAYFNPSVACFIASTLAIITIFLLDRLSPKRKAPQAAETGAGAVSTFDVIMPYLVLVVLVVVVLLVGPVNRLLGQFQVGLTLPDGTGGASVYSPLSIFTHSGTVLLVTAVLLYAWYLKKGHVQRQNMGVVVSNALKKAGQSILPVLCLIIMSKVMDGTGQITVLAGGVAGLMQGAYPFAAPFIGILGSFICSSNMSSNILFTGFQNSIAASLEMDPAVILAAQTAGGSIGNLLATSNIVLGLITTKAAGQENRVLKFLFPIALGIGLLCGILTFNLL